MFGDVAFVQGSIFDYPKMDSITWPLICQKGDPVSCPPEVLPAPSGQMHQKKDGVSRVSIQKRGIISGSEFVWFAPYEAHQGRRRIDLWVSNSRSCFGGPKGNHLIFSSPELVPPFTFLLLQRVPFVCH